MNIQQVLADIICMIVLTCSITSIIVATEFPLHFQTSLLPAPLEPQSSIQSERASRHNIVKFTDAKDAKSPGVMERN